jgi:hypothetical protein
MPKRFRFALVLLALLLARPLLAFDPFDARRTLDALLGPQSPLLLLGPLETEQQLFDVQGDRSFVELRGLKLSGGKASQSPLSLLLREAGQGMVSVELVDWPQEITLEGGGRITWQRLNWRGSWDVEQVGWDRLLLEIEGLNIASDSLNASLADFRLEARARPDRQQIQIRLSEGSLDVRGGMDFLDQIDSLVITASLPEAQGSMASLYDLLATAARLAAGTRPPMTDLTAERPLPRALSGLEIAVTLEGYQSQNRSLDMTGGLARAQAQLSTEARADGTEALRVSTRLDAPRITAPDLQLDSKASVLGFDLQLLTEDQSLSRAFLEDFSLLATFSQMQSLVGFTLDLNAEEVLLHASLPQALQTEVDSESSDDAGAGDGAGAANAMQAVGPVHAKVNRAAFNLSLAPPSSDSRDLLMDAQVQGVRAIELPNLGAYDALAEPLIVPLLPKDLRLQLRLPELSETTWQQVLQLDFAALLDSLADFPALVLDGSRYQAPALQLTLDGQLSYSPAAPLGLAGELSLRTRDISATIVMLRDTAQIEGLEFAQLLATMALGLQFVANFGTPQEDESSLFRVTFPEDSMPLLNGAPLPNLPF